jgi:hypothetical protein
MILCCAGSRDLVHADHCVIMAQAIERWIARNGPVTRVLSGGCRGGDALGECWAETTDTPWHLYKADWVLHGNGAGPRRNQRMIDDADGLVVVRFADSRGSADVLRRAVAKFGVGSGKIEDVVIGRCANAR